MVEFSERALVLKVGRFREQDLWVRIFSPTRGAYTAFAFGGCRSRRRFCGCLDALNQVRFHVKSDRRGSYLYLMEGTLEDAYPRIRQDRERLGQAVNCLKFFEAVHLGPEGAAEGYGLITQCLETLDRSESVSGLFPVLFRAKVAFSQGYAPSLTACSHCGKGIHSGSSLRLDVERGRVCCAACAERAPGLDLGGEALDLLERVRTSGPRDWRDARPGSEVRRQCYAAVDLYVRYHLGLAWAGGSFRKI
ncbi:MAG: DNA repair protein RecO [Thermodesulfobacteriota bacterium]